MWVSFLIIFLWARIWTFFVGGKGINVTQTDQVQVGSEVVIYCYHPHPIAFGIFLLAIAGWIGIHYSGKLLTRVAAVVYGAGLGFIVDEVALVVSGIGEYQHSDLPEVLFLFILVSALMMSSIYFPSFWASLEGWVKTKYRRHRKASSASMPADEVAPPGERRPPPVAAPGPGPQDPKP